MYEGNVAGLEESFTLDTHYTFKVSPEQHLERTRGTRGFRGYTLRH